MDSFSSSSENQKNTRLSTESNPIPSTSKGIQMANSLVGKNKKKEANVIKKPKKTNNKLVKKQKLIRRKIKCCEKKILEEMHLISRRDLTTKDSVSINKMKNNSKLYTRKRIEKAKKILGAKAILKSEIQRMKIVSLCHNKRLINLKLKSLMRRRLKINEYQNNLKRKRKTINYESPSLKPVPGQRVNKFSKYTANLNKNVLLTICNPAKTLLNAKYSKNKLNNQKKKLINKNKLSSSTKSLQDKSQLKTMSKVTFSKPKEGSSKNIKKPVETFKKFNVKRKIKIDSSRELKLSKKMKKRKKKEELNFTNKLPSKLNERKKKVLAHRNILFKGKSNDSTSQKKNFISNKNSLKKKGVKGKKKLVIIKKFNKLRNKVNFYPPFGFTSLSKIRLYTALIARKNSKISLDQNKEKAKIETNKSDKKVQPTVTVNAPLKVSIEKKSKNSSNKKLNISGSKSKLNNKGNRKKVDTSQLLKNLPERDRRIIVDCEKIKDRKRSKNPKGKESSLLKKGLKRKSSCNEQQFEFKKPFAPAPKKLERSLAENREDERNRKIEKFFDSSLTFPYPIWFPTSCHQKPSTIICSGAKPPSKHEIRNMRKKITKHSCNLNMKFASEKDINRSKLFCNLANEPQSLKISIPIIRNPIVKHNINLLRHKRELEYRIAQVKKEGLVYPNFKPLPPVSSYFSDELEITAVDDISKNKESNTSTTLNRSEESEVSIIKISGSENVNFFDKDFQEIEEKVKSEEDELTDHQKCGLRKLFSNKFDRDFAKRNTKFKSFGLIRSDLGAGSNKIMQLNKIRQIGAEKSSKLFEKNKNVEEPINLTQNSPFKKQNLSKLIAKKSEKNVDNKVTTLNSFKKQEIRSSIDNSIKNEVAYHQKLLENIQLQKVNYSIPSFDNYARLGGYTENIPMNQNDIFETISKSLLVFFTQAGFTHANTSAYELMTEIASNFFNKISTCLIRHINLEKRNIDHGFPDAIERCLIETGFGGVRSLEEYYKKKIVGYEKRMMDKCLDLSRKYADITKSKCDLKVIEEVEHERDYPTTRRFIPRRPSYQNKVKLTQQSLSPKRNINILKSDKNTNNNETQSNGQKSGLSKSNIVYSNQKEKKILNPAKKISIKTPTAKVAEQEASGSRPIKTINTQIEKSILSKNSNLASLLKTSLADQQSKKSSHSGNFISKGSLPIKPSTSTSMTLPSLGSSLAKNFNLTSQINRSQNQTTTNSTNPAKKVQVDQGNLLRLNYMKEILNADHSRVLLSSSSPSTSSRPSSTSPNKNTKRK